MGRSLTNNNTISTQGFERQPLPLFAAYSCYSGSPECTVLDSEFNMVSRSTQSANSQASAQSGEIWTAYASYFHTHSNISTSGAGGYWIKSTTVNSADGNAIMRLSSNGCMSAKNPDSMANIFVNFGVVIGPEGYRQPMSLSFSGTTVQQLARGTNVVLDTLTTTLNNASASTWVGNNNMRSAIGYNMLTGTLVIIAARDTSCNYRMHIWKNFTTRLTGRPGELNKFILDAKAGLNGGSYNFYDFTWNANSSTSYTESQYRMRVIPCNNGQIALARFVPSNCAHMAVATINTNNTLTLNTTFTTVSCTTSYGQEQGTHYGMKHQVTWSNKWVACYAPYYYYGCGISGFAINVDDPTKHYRISYTSSTCGVTLLPVRSDGFVYSFNQANNDSNAGMSIGLFDFSNDGFQPNSAIAIGGALTMNTVNGIIDTGYTSTNYSCLATVENWNF